MHIGVVHIGVTDWNPPSLWLFTVKWIKALTAGNKISFLNQILAVFSGSYVVVLGIYYKFQTFLYLPASGIVQGMRPLIGYNYGAGELKRVKKLLGISVLLNGSELIYIQEELVDIILELAAGKNKSLTMCQDVIPNTAEGKKMMYAITWNEDGTKMLQVGIEPKRLLNEIKQNNISNVVAGMPVYKAMEIMVADADTQVIEGATDSSKLGKKLEDVGISSDHVSADDATVIQIRMGGKHCRCMMHQNDNYIVIVTVEDSFYQQSDMIAFFIVGVYLVLASCCITYMFSKVIEERLQKEKLIYTSNTDALTRCLNRHAYENDMKKLNLSEEWVYISADLNGLKQANDSYGHMAGDELICAAADCMRDSFHEYGKVYRIGGDEFAVIITENTSQVEELIHGFDSNVANWHGKFVDSMTVSYGWVFSTERNWGSAYEISKAADARMYQSKERYYKESGADRR